jgi:hypothetical protein
MQQQEIIDIEGLNLLLRSLGSKKGKVLATLLTYKNHQNVIKLDSNKIARLNKLDPKDVKVIMMQLNKLDITKTIGESAYMLNPKIIKKANVSEGKYLDEIWNQLCAIQKARQEQNFKLNRF